MKMSRDVPDLQAWWVPWVGGVLVVLVLLYSLYTWHEREERVAMLVEMQTALMTVQVGYQREADFYKNAPANALDWKPEHWKRHAELMFDQRVALEYVQTLGPQYSKLIKSRFPSDKIAELRKVEADLKSQDQPSPRNLPTP